jgi:hypothetical protein
MQDATGDVARRGSGGRRVIALVLAAIVTSAVWFVAHTAVDGDIVAKSGGNDMTVTLPSVIVATLVSGLLGWALLAILERKASSPRKTWTISAVVVFVLSLLGGPLGGVTTSAKISLACLHAAAALVLIPLFARTAAERREDA